MFLFNGLGRAGGAGGVDSALQFASRRTGVDIGYLKTTAQRESNLDPNARAGTSSATGLFQFIERTWLGVLKQTGDRHGYGELADKIQPTAGGDFTVADAEARQEILALREDPKAAALMAGEFTARNAETLKTALGRPPSDGELYAAHFLGARGAAELVRLAETAPGAPAVERFPAAAAANRSIFYGAGGQPRSAGEVYQRLTSGYDATPAVPESARYLAFAAGRADENQVFHGLFRGTGSGLGPIGKTVSGFWSGFPSEKSVYGMTEDPGAPGVDTASVETASVEAGAGSGDVTIRLHPETGADAGDEGGPATAQSEAAAPRRYGRMRDDPSRTVR